MWTLNGTDQPSAANDHAVVLVCDARFFPFAFYLARQIARCHPERTFDLVIVCSETVPLPSDLPAEDVRIVTASGTLPLEHLTESARRSQAAYLCLTLPHLLPEYDRIAYLDCDIAVAIPGLDKFLQLDLQGRALGAVRDIAQWRTPTRRPKEMKALNRPSVPYFNSGVLLIDAARWRAEEISERCASIGQDPGLQAGLLRDDQSVINFALDGRWCELSPVWNWQWTWSSRLFADTAGHGSCISSGRGSRGIALPFQRAMHMATGLSLNAIFPITPASALSGPRRLSGIWGVCWCDIACD